MSHPVLAATATALVLALAGCGGTDAGEVLSETSDRLGDVRSGHLELRVLAAPAGDPDRGVGFQLTGPFALGGDDPLPVTRMRYTRLLGDRRVSAVFTSTGTEAFVTAEGRTTPLPADAVQALRRPSGADAGGGRGRSLSDLGLQVDDWIEDPEVSAGTELDGAATDRVTGRLRTGRAVRDVLGALRRSGLRVPEAGEGLVTRLDGLVRSARAEVVAGREDRLLRRLDLRLDLRPAEELDAAVPGAGAIRLTARLDLRRPNRRVEVARPVP